MDPPKVRRIGEQVSRRVSKLESWRVSELERSELERNELERSE